MPASASEGTTDDSHTRSVSHAPVGARAEAWLRASRRARRICRRRSRCGIAASTGSASPPPNSSTWPRRDHRAQQRDVVGVARGEIVEQRAAHVDREAERRVVGQRAQERAVAALVRVVDHGGKVAGGLVRVHAEQQGDGSGHGAFARQDRALLGGGSVAEADRLRERGRRGRGDQGVEVREARAEETVERRDGFGGIVVAEPPEPVGALAGREQARRSAPACAHPRGRRRCASSTARFASTSSSHARFLSAGRSRS